MLNVLIVVAAMNSTLLLACSTSTQYWKSLFVFSKTHRLLNGIICLERFRDLRDWLRWFICFICFKIDWQQANEQGNHVLTDSNLIGRHVCDQIIADVKETYDSNWRKKKQFFSPLYRIMGLYHGSDLSLREPNTDETRLYTLRHQIKTGRWIRDGKQNSPINPNDIDLTRNHTVARKLAWSWCISQPIYVFQALDFDEPNNGDQISEVACRYSTLFFMMDHFKRVIRAQTERKMTIEAFAICLTPCLFGIEAHCSKVPHSAGRFLARHHEPCDDCPTERLIFMGYRFRLTWIHRSE